MYKQLCETPSDINENLPVLKALTEECETVCEMGVRYCVSTFAFIEGNPKKLTSIDIVHPRTYVHQGGPQSFDKVVALCKERGIDFEFIESSTLDITIKPVDLLFIDTLHTYEQLSKELALHGNKAKKYLVFHDTVSCPELMPAIEEFMAKGKFKLHAHHTNNNGLLVLKRC